MSNKYAAKAEQVGPFKILVAYLPWPEADKNSRYSPNCIASEKGGRMYFKPRSPMWKLSGAAARYRAHVVGLVAGVLPVTPWYDASPWEAQLTQVKPQARADIDHHAGVMDDLIHAGLAVDDRHCTALALYAQAAPDEEGGLWWFSRQLVRT